MLSIDCRFWQCPNGKECKYRHALPPGYVLKSQMKVLSQFSPYSSVNYDMFRDLVENTSPHNARQVYIL